MKNLSSKHFYSHPPLYHPNLFCGTEKVYIEGELSISLFFGYCLHRYNDFAYASTESPEGARNYYGIKGVNRVGNMFIMYGCIAFLFATGVVLFTIFKWVYCSIGMLSCLKLHCGNVTTLSTDECCFVTASLWVFNVALTLDNYVGAVHASVCYITCFIVVILYRPQYTWPQVNNRR